MITVGMYYDVLPGKEKEFEEKFEAVTDTLEGQAGHVQSLLYQQVKKPNSYTILSEWKAQEDFMTFIRSDAFRAVTDWGKAEILAGQTPPQALWPRGRPPLEGNAYAGYAPLPAPGPPPQGATFQTPP